MTQRTCLIQKCLLAEIWPSPYMELVNMEQAQKHHHEVLDMPAPEDLRALAKGCGRLP
jgi:hypothetical protein